MAFAQVPFVLTAENDTRRAFQESIEAMKDMARKATAIGKLPGFGGGQAQGSSKTGSAAAYFARSLRAVGIASAGAAVVGLGRRAMRTADEITDMADSMGVSTDSAQTLKILARDTSVSFEGLSRTFAKLNADMIDAFADPEGDAAERFLRIGISIEKLKGMKVEEVFQAAGTALRDARAPAYVHAAALDLLGQQATKLGPIFDTLAKTGLPALNAELLRSGEIMDQVGLKNLAALQARIERLNDKLTVKSMQTMDFASRGTNLDYAYKNEVNRAAEKMFPGVNAGIEAFAARHQDSTTLKVVESIGFKILALLDKIWDNTGKAADGGGVFR